MNNYNIALLIASIVLPGLVILPGSYAATAKDVVRKPAFILTTPTNNVDITISSDTTEQALVKLIGKKNVKHGPIGTGEGETVPGTVLFPDSKDRRMDIIWADEKQHRLPETVNIWGPDSLWRTNSGLKIGVPLKELHKQNGKAFTMSGFGWDYGGRITNWNNGKLQKLYVQPDSSVAIQLGYRQGQSAPRELDGDIEILSSNPAMQKLNPSVEAIYMSFDQTKARPSK